VLHNRGNPFVGTGPIIIHLLTTVYYSFWCAREKNKKIMIITRMQQQWVRKFHRRVQCLMLVINPFGYVLSPRRSVDFRWLWLYLMFLISCSIKVLNAHYRLTVLNCNIMKLYLWSSIHMLITIKLSFRTIYIRF
jgi:hypothetical protein